MRRAPPVFRRGFFLYNPAFSLAPHSPESLTNPLSSPYQLLPRWVMVGRFYAPKCSFNIFSLDSGQVPDYIMCVEFLKTTYYGKATFWDQRRLPRDGGDGHRVRVARQVVSALTAAAGKESADGEAAEQPPAVQADGGPREPHEDGAAEGPPRSVAGDAHHGVQPLRQAEQGVFLIGCRGAADGGLGAADYQRGRAGGASVSGHTTQSAASGCQLP